MKYWLKNRFVANLITTTVLLTAVFSLFVYPFMRDRLNEYNDISVFVNTNIDFDIPEPSVEQVVELWNKEFIHSIYPYFLDEQHVLFNNRTRRTSILFADLSSGEFAMYNSSRLIEGSLTTWRTNQAYIDFAYHRETGAQVGDTISFPIMDEDMDFVVTAIFETNNRFLRGGAIAINLTNEIRDLIGWERGYSGAFVVASDYSQARSYMWHDYRPLGRLRDRALFESDEIYQMHVDMITNRPYQNEIVFFRDRLPNAPVAAFRHGIYFLSLVLIILLSVVINVVFFLREKGHWKEKILSGGNPRGYYRLALFFDFIISLLVIYVILYINQNFLYDNFFAPSIATPIHISMYITVILSCIACYMVNVLMLKILREPKVEIGKALNVAISPWNGKLQSTSLSTSSNFMQAENISDAVANNLKHMGYNVFTIFDNEKLTQAPRDEEIFEFHNSQERKYDVLTQFNTVSSSMYKDASSIEIFYFPSKKEDVAKRIAHAIAEASGLPIKGVYHTSNIDFFYKSDKPIFLIHFTMAKKEEEIYNKKFDEICIAIAEGLSGNKMSPMPSGNIAKPLNNAKK